jgi:threonine/homoserine/homoserine lactone efflux protein
MFPWPAFLSYSLIMIFTPGPNNIMSMNNAAQKGLRKALPFNLGILIGAFFVMIFGAVFSSILLTLIPRIQFPMKILGAAYMLYLALKILKPPKTRELNGSGRSFIAGIVLQFINPKLVIFAITIMATFVLPWYTSIPVLLCFALFLAITGFASTVCWAAFGSLFSKIFIQHGRLLNIIMAVLLVYCAVSLFL